MTHPPRIARRLLARRLPAQRGAELIQELDDEYRDRAAERGRVAAGLWYWIQVLRPSTTDLGRELWEVRTMKIGRHRVPGVAPKGLLDILGTETRLAVRSLRHRPGFSVLVVLTLALGIGANTAIFTVVNGVLLSPLAYPEPGGLVAVGVGPGQDGDLDFMSLPDVEDLEAQSPALGTLVAYDAGTTTLTGMGEPTLVRTGRINKGLLPTFGLAPLLGRDIREDESGADAARVVVISHAFWRDRFDASPNVLGRTVTLSDVAFEVIGVAPPGFDFPAGADVWYPRHIDPEGCGRDCHTWLAIGRLARGASVQSAQAEADAIAARLSDAYPVSNHEKTFGVRTLRDEMVGRARTGLWLLLGAGLAVLLIACANVANLVLARAETRIGEAAVRSALGASRGRLVASMLSESALLAVLGGGCGLAVAAGGVSLLRRLSAGAVPRMETVTIDGVVLLFALLLVAAVTLVFGLTPALRASRAAVATGIRQAGRGAAVGGGRRLRQALTMAETALAVVLLSGAGLMLRTFAQLYAVDPGFETDRILRFTLSLPDATYPDLGSIRTFYRTLEDRIASRPGVEAVGSIYGAPLSPQWTAGTTFVEGRPDPAPGQEIGALMRPIGPGYVETMRISILRGRDLEPADDRSDVPVALVNQVFARELFGDEDPIGKRVRVSVDFGYGSPYMEIVGVVGDIRGMSLTDAPTPEIYAPQGQIGPGYMTVSVRSSLPPAGLLDAVRSEVRRLDANLPLRGVETVEDAIDRQTAPTRFMLVIVGAFAGLALLLAAVGLYGVMAYLVTRRMREMGVRIALGARPGEITRLVLVGGFGPAIAGVAIGVLVSLAGGRVVESLLYGVSARDPLTLVAVPLLLLVVAIAAVLVPARRATRVDPVAVLRAE